MRAGAVWILALSSLSAASFAADESFIHDAAQDGMAMVALAHLAAAKGSSDALKTLGRTIVDEQGVANAKLTAAAAESGVKLPAGMAEEAKATQTKLASLSGKAFDQAYVESQSNAHARTIKVLETELASGNDRAAKAWALETLPMVKRHAEMTTGLGAMPGEHEREHALSTAGPADAPPVTPATP